MNPNIMILRRCPRLLKLKAKFEGNPKICCGSSFIHCRNSHHQTQESNIIKSAYEPITIQNQSLTDYIWRDFGKWPELTAIKCGVTGRSFNYSTTRQLCRKFGVSLLKSGVSPTNVIAVVLPNTPENVVVNLGALEAGVIVSPVNPLYGPEEIAKQIQDSSSVAVVTLPDFLPKVLEAKSKLGETNASLSNKLQIIVTPGVDGKESQIPPGVLPYSKMVDQSVNGDDLDKIMDNHKIDPDEPVVLPYSSGTTGLPKGVCLTHNNITSNLEQITVPDFCSFEPSSKSYQEVVPQVLPMFHIYGLVIILLQTFCFGGKVVTLPKFDPNMFLRALKDEKSTIVYLAPPLILFLGSHPAVTKEHLASAKIVLSGAAPCSDSDINRCLDKSPKNVIYKQGYGLTETSPAVCSPPKGFYKLQSVGIPVPGCEVKLVDVNTGEALPANKEGELWVRGPQVMKGYLNNPKATAEVIDKDGWFHTGDIAYYDEDQGFYIVDRLKELIKVKGFQVAPAELEAVLRSHPSIQDAGVIGVPDERTGEKPVAFIALRPNQSKPSTEDLSKFVLSKVAPFKKLDDFIFTEAIPKSGAGKILRKVLRAEYMKTH